MPPPTSLLENKNPFSPSYPIHPKFFSNREDILNSFKRAIFRSTKYFASTPDNIAILGNWGLGKSSLLRKFEFIAIEDLKDRNTFSAIVELTPSSCNSFASLQKKIVEDIDSNFMLFSNVLPSTSAIRNEIKNWNFRYSNDKESVENEIAIITKLKEALIELWRILEKRANVDTAILMIDDLNYFLEKYPSALYDLWSVFQGLQKHGCNFVTCISSNIDLISNENKENIAPISRFFNITHSLKEFELNETKNAILKPIELSGLRIDISEEVLERIHEFSQGHPFFIHFIMRELLSFREKKFGKINLEFFEKNFPFVREIIETEKFRNDFLIASKKEREILREIANLGGEKFSPSDIKKVKDARTQLRFLLKKNLIVKHERGEYSLYHPLFREYLQKLRKKR